MKTVVKPWGSEAWVVVNESYALKRIVIKEGTRSSLQYHQRKLETIYVESGSLRAWLEDRSGRLRVRVVSSGGTYTVLPGRRHRVLALEDCVLFEVSTPELDDLVRVEDDYGRK
jgi:mannose-6-phosphate isomerase